MNKNVSSKIFILDTQYCCIPHPEKIEKGGEDAFYISNNKNVIAVFDGVGGWSFHGIDPSIYAKKLADGLKEAYEKFNIKNSVNALTWAYENAKEIKGSSTACIAIVNGNYLDCCNIGDSALMLIRNGNIFFKTKEQQHDFNFPFQLGTGHITTPKSDAEVYLLEIEEGDIIVLATDGLFDNLFDDEILEIVIHYDYSKNLAQILANFAFKNAFNTKKETPFSRQAYQLGLIEFPCGGKLDDITVITAKVVPYKQETSYQNKIGQQLNKNFSLHTSNLH